MTRAWRLVLATSAALAPLVAEAPYGTEIGHGRDPGAHRVAGGTRAVRRMSNPDPTRHDGTILRMRPWFYWQCSCGAQSGPPYYATATLASEAWADHVKDAEEASRPS